MTNRIGFKEKIQTSAKKIFIMENNSTPNNDLEKLLRDQLGQLDATPDETAWANIAARQSRRNVWLRWRRYVYFAAPAVALLIVAGIGWQRAQAPGQTPGQQNAPNREATPNGPVAALPTAENWTENPFFSDQNVDPKSPGTEAIPAGPRFGARINTVPGATVRFQAETGLRYESPVSGTTVYIPANSLVDPTGRPVSGEVELLFREYRGIVDYLASGIPMHYGDTRGAFFFNSGGMFEVRVRQDGETLQMAPGQSYDLGFTPTDRLTSPALFYFEEKNGAWQYQPDRAFAGQSGALPAVVSESEAARNNTDGQNPDCLPELRGVKTDNAQEGAKTVYDGADYMQEGVKTGYELASGRLSMPVWFRKNPQLTDEQVLNGIETGRIRVVRDRDGFEQLFPEDFNGVFTELKAFKDCYFIRRVDSLEHSTITQKLASEKFWERIYIFREQGAACRITLYTRDKKVEFYADLVPTTEAKSFNFDKVLAEYGRLRQQRQRDFTTLSTRLRGFLFIAPVFQTPAEWCMTPPDWLEYFEKNRPLMQKRYRDLIESGFTTNDSIATATCQAWNDRLRKLYFDRFDKTASQEARKNGRSLQYALRLTNFGLYNCDQIFRLGRDPVYVYTDYRTPDGLAVTPASVSVLDRATRLYFTLSDADRLIHLPGRRFDIIVTGRNGRSYYLPAEEYANAKLRPLETNRIVVQDVTDKTAGPREWADLLNI